MNQLIFLAALFVSVFAAETSLLLPNQLLLSAFQESKTEQCKNVEVKCANCTHIGLCTAVGAAPTLISCFGSTPYCNDRACSSKPSSECDGGKISSFSCPQKDGHYPDPNDCRLYHICVNKTATDYNCQPSDVYSTTTHSCVRHSARNPCSTVNCYGKNGQYALYQADSRFAFFCVAGKSTGILVKCDEDQEYDTDVNLCRPHCTKEGLLPDPDDKKKFIECTLDVGLNFKMRRLECPNSSNVKSVFDPEKSECVLKKAK